MIQPARRGIEAESMTFGLLFAIIIGGAALVAYSITEIRINQRTCRLCGFRMSIDSPDEQCPKCGTTT